MSKLFSYLDLETASMCNRTCPTCIRNSHPDREAVASFFKPKYLSMKLIKEALDQCLDLHFEGGVCLSHYNEPLMDKRLPEIVRLVKSYGFFVFFNTNGDYLTEELASKLDGVLDKINVTLYMDEPIKSQRAGWVRSLFHHTDVQIAMYSEHIATHFSPKYDVKALAQAHINNRCTEPQLRVIINHRQQYLLCCDDVIGNFDLGKFPKTSIQEFWFGEKRTQIMNDLDAAGNRSKYSYCSACPRP